MNLQRKFRIGIILLVFIPVIMMGVASYYIFSGMNEEKTNSFYRVSLQDTDRKLEYALNEINAVSDLAIIQPSVQQLLKHPPERVSSELAQSLNNLIMAHPKITSFALYSNHKQLYGTAGEASMYHDPAEAPWYSRAVTLEGRPLWLGPGENGSSKTDGPVLVHARVIKDYYSLKTIGSLVITVKPDVLEQALWGTSTIADSDILLLSQDGTVVFDKSGNETGNTIPAQLWQHPNRQGYQIVPYRDQESMITVVPSSHEAWTLTAITPLKTLHRESNVIRIIAIALILFTLFMTFVFEHIFIRRVVRTIIISARGMKRVMQGQFTQLRPPTRWNDETKMLIDGFNQMSTQIRDLLGEVEQEQKRKKEAEMNALVAQINPHFIYNSLESINSMAVLAGNREISRMVISLGKLLRISISENSEAIPLATELEHVKHYLNIQKMRFRDKFDYVIICPPELNHMLTLKLIVQPLVENALYHGIEPNPDPGFIRVEAMEDCRDVVIEVADSGMGFDPEGFERAFQNRAKESKFKNSGVGLKNVYERIRIQYGFPYGIMVCSAEGYGTIIRIRIPKQWNTSGEGGRHEAAH